MVRWQFMLIGVGMFAAGASAQTPGAAPTVRVALDQIVSTRTAHVGDVVALHTVDPAVLNGQLVPRGSLCTARVIRAKRAGRFHGHADLAIGKFAVVGPDGTVLARSDASVTALPRRRAYRGYWDMQADAERTVMTGMGAGYAAALVASRFSRSEDTVVRAGVLSGLAAIILMKTMPRGPDLEITPGGAIAVVLVAGHPDASAAKGHTMGRS